MIKYFLITVFCLCGTLSYSQYIGRLDTVLYFDFVEENPTYEGGDKQLYKDVQDKVEKVCAISADSNKIVIHFIVETDGSVKIAKLFKGICPEMNNNALEEVKKLKFKPGRQNGKLVRVKYAVLLKYS